MWWKNLDYAKAAAETWIDEGRWYAEARLIRTHRSNHLFVKPGFPIPSKFIRSRNIRINKGKRINTRP